MREKHRPDMSEEEATQLMHECLKVRGCLAMRVCVVGAKGHITQP